VGRRGKRGEDVDRQIEGKLTRNKQVSVKKSEKRNAFTIPKFVFRDIGKKNMAT